MWVRFPPGTACAFYDSETLGYVRQPGLRLIRFLPKAHPYGLGLCRSLPSGCVPAGNGLCDFVSLRLTGNVRASRLRLIRLLPLAHLRAVIHVAGPSSAPFPRGTIGYAIFLPVAH
jgi:hypothetical protein